MSSENSAPAITRARWTPLVVVGVVCLLLLRRHEVRALVAGPRIDAWSTIFVALVVQALPFLVLGVAISAAIAVLVPPSVFARLLPRREALAVPVAGLAGAVLPGCECGSVPVAGGLMARGVRPSAALAFMLSAPAINPIVMVSTAVAFSGRAEMVVARFVASLATAAVVGWLWARFGSATWIRPMRRPDVSGMPAWQGLAFAARHDFLNAGGFLVVGAATAATLNVVVPRSWLGTVGGLPVVSLLTLAVLAVVLAICSEADAFVAASLTGFSSTAQLAFMVVGPTVDLKLVALQSGTFGRSFVLRFAPATFGVAVVASVIVGWWLL